MRSPTVLSCDDMAPAVTVQGGAIDAFRHADLAIFCTQVMAPSLASFPMLPFCSPIKQGRFRQAGQQTQLAPNFPPEPQAIHGFGQQSLWQIESLEAHACALIHEHEENCSAVTRWPWVYRGPQRFLLTQSALHLTLSIENCSDHAMPVVLDLHPYVPLTPDTFVEFQCRDQVSMGKDFLSRDSELDHGRLVNPLAHEPWQTESLDSVFTRRNGDATTVWPGQHWSLRIEPDAALAHWSAYAPESEGFICIEPVSHLPNAINLESAANISGGMGPLATGAVWQTTTVFQTLSDSA